ncbi:MAG: hypothetical protein AUK35_00485 [Zetaproteobacteria bacterium CG2_30_46_52]|nr:MAG: hypothetical protein AUK35_00485 [Zetaproteobacteria bacterium CG2_30_46_52]
MLSFLTDSNWALFLSALISSTLFPGGSEALLIFRLEESPTQLAVLVSIATLGNVLGSMITYGMGRLGYVLGSRWFQMPQQRIAQAEQYFSKYGKLTLLFAWLPIIGDPICLVAGVLRYHFIGFVLLVSLGKLVRYSLLAWFTVSALA